MKGASHKRTIIAISVGNIKRRPWLVMGYVLSTIELRSLGLS